MLKKSKLIAVIAAMFAAPAFADDAGKSNYLSNCASCHGVEGYGDGPVSEFMNLRVPDLTGIAARNDGIFPMLKVIHIIDGRTGVRGHGSNMPVWGDEFTPESLMVGDYSGVYLARGRVLSIAYYLESIQN